MSVRLAMSSSVESVFVSGMSSVRELIYCKKILTANRLRVALGGASIGQITAQATLVETQAVGLRVCLKAVQRRGDWAQADGHVPERTAGDTAGAVAGGDHEAGHGV